LNKVAKILGKFYRAISIFVVIADGILMAYFVAVNLIDVISGKYGPSTYATVISGIIAAIIFSAFYLGTVVEKRREPKRRRLSRVRSSKFD
jgi:hypothetical protein